MVATGSRKRPWENYPEREVDEAGMVDEMRAKGIWLKPTWVSLVKTYLIERGIRFSWFAEKTGVVPAQWAKYERGERNAPSTFRAAASLALKVPQEQLFVKVMVRDRSDIIYERDAIEDRRIVRVLVDRGDGEEVVWQLANAPWKGE